jgi:hypothetical protein
MKKIIEKILSGICGAFIVFTAIWIFWCIITPGDYFANGSIALEPSLFAGIIIGLLLGSLIKIKGLKYILLILVIAGICYWLLVPDGWWAVGPA